MERFKVIFLDPTTRYRRSLRRFRLEAAYCSSRMGYCSASALIDAELVADTQPISGSVPWPRDDARWPKHCECGYEFAEGDVWSVDHDRLYQPSDGGAIVTLRDAPVGACWDATWYHDWRTGHDGRSLVVRCPDGHDWFIDNRSSNCTLKDDDVHRCWVRRGRPEDGDLHVDKQGDTCSAGGGSIDTGKWHGFLHDGHLARC
jgi:hypothetical protein